MKNEQNCRIWQFRRKNESHDFGRNLDGNGQLISEKHCKILSHLLALP